MIINESIRLNEGIIQCYYDDDSTFGTATITDGKHTYTFKVDKFSTRHKNKYNKYMDFSGRPWNDKFNKFINLLVNDGIFTSIDGKWKM